MAKAKQRYMEIVEEFPIELHKPILRLADAIMEQARAEFAVRREDFDELRSAIAGLAQAQKRTEERVEELAQAQKRTEERVEELAQAQKRTEERVEELAQAQKRTEERVEELAQAQKRTEERVEELAQVQKRFEKHFDMQIGALGSRWGIKTEESFRAAAEGILGEDFGLHVERYVAYDEQGEVFGRPDQVEIDILIRDDKITAIEIKSSMSKSDVYAFAKKVSYYEKRHQVQVDRKIIVTPMLDPRATKQVKSLGMKVYTSCYEWGDEELK
jgi:hypothetical protein